MGKDLDAAQTVLDAAKAQLDAFIVQADALQAEDFQRGYTARQGRVREAEDNVRQLSTRLPRLPVGGSLIDLWERFDAPERREVLAAFLGRVIVQRGASSDLENQVVVEWADGSVANDEARVRVTAA